jgi:CRP-like cAMP-binding protein
LVNLDQVLGPCSCSYKTPDCPKAFLKLSEQESEKLFRRRREVVYQPQELIVKQSTSLTHLICIKSGFVKQYVETTNGKHLIFNVLTNPHAIGFCDFLLDEPISYSVAALTEVTTCLVPIEDLRAIVSANPKLAGAILRYVSKMNQEMLHDMVGLTQNNMYQKVAHILLDFKEKMNGMDTYTIPLSRQEIADMCSLTKESLIRVFKELKDANYVQIQGNSIHILNQQALEKISTNNINS